MTVFPKGASSCTCTHQTLPETSALPWCTLLVRRERKGEERKKEKGKKGRRKKGKREKGKKGKREKGKKGKREKGKRGKRGKRERKSGLCWSPDKRTIITIKTTLNEKSATAQILRFPLILLIQLHHHRPEGRGEKGVGSDGRREGGGGARGRMVRDKGVCVVCVGVVEKTCLE